MNTMSKTVTVYVLETDEKSVNFPTKARAKHAQEILTMFGLTSEIKSDKKKIEI